MVLDRDYPMSRNQGVILLSGLAIMVVVGVALFGGFLPGIHPDYQFPSSVTLDGHTYHMTQVPLRTPVFANHTAPWNVTYENVTFELWLTDWYAVTGGQVHGVGTEPNGTAYPFALGAPLANGTRPTLYLSPDWAFGIRWTGGLIAGLYVVLLVEYGLGP